MIRERAYNGLPGLPVLFALLLVDAGLLWMLVMNVRQESVPEVVTAAVGIAIAGLALGVRNQLRSLGFEVAVAEPAVVLPAGVDDPAHRQRADAAGRVVELARALVGGTAVDEHRTAGCEHQA